MPGQNVKVFSFDLPFGANNQSGHASSLDTYGFSGATLGCQIGSLSITSACPPMSQPQVFQIGFQVQFANRGDVTITLSRSGSSLSQTLSGITSGSYFASFNLGAMPSSDETLQINGTGVENGVSFTASATAHIMAPIVIVPGIQPTDPNDVDLGGGSPQGLIDFLSGGFPSSNFICPPLVEVAPFCLPHDPLARVAGHAGNVHPSGAITVGGPESAPDRARRWGDPGPRLPGDARSARGERSLARARVTAQSGYAAGAAGFG